MNICVNYKLLFLCFLLAGLCFSEVFVGTDTAKIKGSWVVYGKSIYKMDNYIFALDQDEVNIENLNPGTTYWYKTEKHIGSFTTLGRPPIEFENIEVSSLTKTSCLVKIRTNLKTQCYINDFSNSLDFKKEHSISLKGLLPNKTYPLFITAIDEEGQTGTTMYSFKTKENNLALNCKVSGTFNHILNDKYVNGKGNPLDRITDGDLSYFNGTSQSGDITKADQQLIIDLGTLTKISTITVFWRRLAYSCDYSISVSDDEDRWTVLKEGLNANDGEYIRSESGDPMMVQSISNLKIEGRYVKLLLKKGSRFFVKHPNWNFVQIAEIKVF